MPSHTAAEALIQLYDLGEFPWSWPTWQEITGIQHGLFPSDDDDLPKGWTREDALDIKSFFHKYNQISKVETKIKFASSSNKDTVPGRKKWSQFVSKNWDKWGIHTLVIEGLRKHGIHPITLLSLCTSVSSKDGTLNANAWPKSDIYVPMAIDTIGMLVFGPEAFNGGDMLPLEIRLCLTAFVQRSWSRIREQVKSDMKRTDQIEKAALSACSGTSFICGSKFWLTSVVTDLGTGRLTKAKIDRAIRTVGRLKNMVEIYGSPQNVSKAEDMMSDITRVMEVLGAKVPKTQACPGKSNRKFLCLACFHQIDDVPQS
jgi:hypothetical protein